MMESAPRGQKGNFLTQTKLCTFVMKGKYVSLFMHLEDWILARCFYGNVSRSSFTHMFTRVHVISSVLDPGGESGKQHGTEVVTGAGVMRSSRDDLSSIVTERRHRRTRMGRIRGDFQ